MEGYEKLGYVALNVSDIGRSRDFYHKQVGLQMSGEAEGVAFLRCSEDHHSLALYASDRPGLKRAGFEMKSAKALDDLAARLAGEGLAVVEIPAAERKLLGSAVPFASPSRTLARPTDSTTTCASGVASPFSRQSPRSSGLAILC
jgi:2,3-dihydroxy-p-cumate/2,3-dihydroxybenzoate 3,4-dioxygenase